VPGRRMYKKPVLLPSAISSRSKSAGTRRKNETYKRIAFVMIVVIYPGGVYRLVLALSGASQEKLVLSLESP
jgi:hypothetical protein